MSEHENAPVIIFEPTLLSGSIVQNASGTATVYSHPVSLKRDSIVSVTMTSIGTCTGSFTIQVCGVEKDAPRPFSHLTASFASYTDAGAFNVALTGSATPSLSDVKTVEISPVGAPQLRVAYTNTAGLGYVLGRVWVK